MLTLIKDLIEQLNYLQIPYCHWKSNVSIKEALLGIGDLDLLIERQSIQQFESIVANLGFKRVIDPLQATDHSLFHFYGLDSDTATMVHLHVYYRLLSGESLLKNYCFPLEKMFLSNCSLEEGIPVPPKEVELVAFVIRMIIKHSSVLEYLFLRRHSSNIPEELDYLLTDDSLEKCQNVLTNCLPQVDINLFEQCLKCLQQESSFFQYFSLSSKLRKQLKDYNRFSFLSEWFARLNIFLKRLLWRFWGQGKSKKLASGGAVIAFAGADATGKSTLVREITNWLNKRFNTSSVHLGKPPSTALSFFPDLLLPLLRKVAPKERTIAIIKSKEKKISLLYAVRSILVARDRYKLALKIRRRAANGQLIICDRYPSTIVGAMDSPRLTIVESENSNWKDHLLRRLAKWEHSFYHRIPAPDIVFYLTVPIEVAIERNRQKQETEDEDYVIRRNNSRIVPSFARSKTIEIESTQSLNETLDQIRGLLWKML